MWTPSGRATGFSSASFSRLVSRSPSSRLTVWVLPVGLPSSSRSGASMGTIWVPKRSSSQALRGVLLGAQAEGVGVVARDAPLVGDALRPLELRRHLVLREVRPGDRDPEAEVLAAAGADRDTAHHLDAAGDGGVDRPAAHQRRGQVGGLLRRPALGVDGGVGDRERQPGAQPGGAADVEGLLAHLAHAAGDDLAHLGRVDPRPLHDRLLDGGEQVGGVDGGEAPVALPDGGADGFDDHDIRHGRNLSGWG